MIEDDDLCICDFCHKSQISNILDGGNDLLPMWETVEGLKVCKECWPEVFPGEVPRDWPDLYKPKTPEDLKVREWGK